MITVDESRPYRRLSEDEWESLSPEMYPIEDVVLSQKHGTTISLIAVQVFGDEYPPVRIVMHKGKAHVHDGHHRTLSEYIKGKKFVKAVVAREKVESMEEYFDRVERQSTEAMVATCERIKQERDEDNIRI